MAQFEVTGLLTPDVSGVYTEAGELNGHPKYEHEDGHSIYAVAGKTGYQWVIGASPGPEVWFGPANVVSPAGAYNPGPGANGTATVAEYVPPSPTAVEIVIGTQGRVVITGATGVTIGGHVVYP